MLAQQLLSSCGGNKASAALGLKVRRFLNLHEYQSKELMRQFRVPAQKGWTASTASEAYEAAKEMKQKEGIDKIVMKCQVFAGGRGKGQLSSGLKGGVQIFDSAEEARNLAKKMIGYNLVTHQTGKEGLRVDKVLLHEGVNIEKEFYLAIILDRKLNGPCVVVSPMGGIDIEDVAENHPEAIKAFPIDVSEGVGHKTIQKVCDFLMGDKRQTLSRCSQKNLSEEQQDKCFRRMRRDLGHCITRLYDLFEKCDASQVEINPLALTSKNEVLCVDAKLSFDDNAQYRQQKLFDQEDTSCRDKKELLAEKAHLNFVSMDGNIGCMVNGAGLAMATMDIIALNGMFPANFLDVGGGADKDQVATAFKVLKMDPNVKAILINIFGGITRCDEIAKGIVAAAKEVGLSHPLVVRLVGNRADIAKEILNSSEVKKLGLNITPAEDLADAARTVCEIARRR